VGIIGVISDEIMENVSGHQVDIVDLYFGDYTGMMAIECLKSLLNKQFEILSMLWKEG
jgi:hypothetical protein